MAENDDQLVYIKRFVNKQYANRVKWFYSVLADTIRHTDNLEVRRLLPEVNAVTSTTPGIRSHTTFTRR